MGLKDLLLRNVETHEKHSNPVFRTHYYKCEYKNAKEVLLNYFKKNKLHVTNVDDYYQELLVETSKYHLIVSIRRAAVLTVAINVKIEVYGLLGGYKPHKIVTELYAVCDKNLPIGIV